MTNVAVMVAIFVVLAGLIALRRTLVLLVRADWTGLFRIVVVFEEGHHGAGSHCIGDAEDGDQQDAVPRPPVSC